MSTLNRLLPRDVRYSHQHGSAGHGADHLLPALLSPSLTLPVQDGHLVLGTWQRVVLVDLNADNPQPTGPPRLPRRLTAAADPP